MKTKVICINSGKTLALNEYHKDKIYDSLPYIHSPLIPKCIEDVIQISIKKGIFEVCHKANFLNIAEWRDKQIDSILED